MVIIRIRIRIYKTALRYFSPNSPTIEVVNENTPKTRYETYNQSVSIKRFLFIDGRKDPQ